MAKNLKQQVASIATVGAIIALAGALSACGPTTASLVPSDVRATLAADARANAPKLTASDILANALGKNNAAKSGGESIVAKTNLSASSSDESDEAQSIVAKTSTIDALTTAGISTHPKTTDDELTNEELANKWVDSGLGDLDGSPAKPLGVDDFPLDSKFEDQADDYTGQPENADELFSSYQETTQSNVNDRDDYDLAIETKSREALDEQDAQAIFNAARAVQANGGKQNVDPNELLVRARTLLAAQNQEQQATPQETILQFAASETKLNQSHFAQVGSFIKQHPDKTIIVSAAPGSAGTAYEKLAAAEQRLTQLGHLAPQLAKATRKIAPHLPADTVEIKVGH